MSLSEFELIERYFTRPGARADVRLGIGDDAAVVEPPPGRQLVMAMDTLVAGHHFPLATAAADIGWKALAVNLSDLAAMAATPAWATLALTLPEADERWLRGFAEGFFELATQYDVALVGGDTTRGPLSVSVHLQGWVESGEPLTRSGAQAGDGIFLTGATGEAALALHRLQAGTDVSAHLLARLNRPCPRVAVGQRLGGLASAAIDISDGLHADLGHLLQASGCGARVELQRLPLTDDLRPLDSAERLQYQLGGGDDYELCFTLRAARREQLQAIIDETGVPVVEIGTVEAAHGIRYLDPGGTAVGGLSPQGYDHFAGDRQ